MASGQDMMAPISLVENDNEQLSVNQEAIKTLEKISQPVVVVAIVGLYCTGKSYLMNCLAGQKHGECCTGAEVIAWLQLYLIFLVFSLCMWMENQIPLNKPTLNLTLKFLPLNHYLIVICYHICFTPVNKNLSY